MRLWTIQTLRAYEVLLNKGALVGARRWIDSDFLDSYEWMARQMTMRLEMPTCAEALPMWAWHQWQGADRPRPDLRTSGYLPPGTVGVRLELDLPDREVLLSDFELWHYVLNYWYLAHSTSEADDFDRALKAKGYDLYRDKPIPDVEIHQKVLSSWQRIFDLDWCESDVAMPRVAKPIQATFWRLETSAVKRVTKFTAR